MYEADVQLVPTVSLPVSTQTHTHTHKQTQTHSETPYNVDSFTESKERKRAYTYMSREIYGGTYMHTHKHGVQIAGVLTHYTMRLRKHIMLVAASFSCSLSQVDSMGNLKI